MSKKAARVLVISDLHCGHKVGLCHPDFSPVYRKRDKSKDWRQSQQRGMLWKKFSSAVNDLKPIDVIIVNGDAVDGKGVKSGGTELITTDRSEQADNAQACIEEAGAKEVYMSFGTPYHTGVDEDWEREVAQRVNAVKIGGHDWVEVNGVVFDYRHFVSRSSIPHGRYTPLAKERLWAALWAEHGEYPKGDILLRSHVHYYAFCGGFGWKAYITPALQAAGTKFGVRRATGTVDWGFLAFDVYGKGDYECIEKVMKFRTAKQHVMRALQTST